MPEPIKEPPRPHGLSVEVVPLGSGHHVACSVVAAHLQAIMGLPSAVASARPVPDAAYMLARCQYDAGILLKELARGIEGNLLRVGVITQDICLPILTYVFGEASVGGRTAVVSLFRLTRHLDGSCAKQGLVYQRLAKVALHEVAHALGLFHCRVPGCLMCCSPGLESLDALTLRFCPYCRSGLVRPCSGFGTNR